jgi:ubiquinone/menaquinone biosynthesis C-methylase UbiE
MIVSKAMSVAAMLAAWMTLAAVDSHAQHGGGNPARFEVEGRDEWQKPDQVVALLDLQPGMTVADIGSSSGYFTRRFSPAVSPKGKVLAVDLDLESLAWLADKAKELGLANIDTVHADPDNPHLPDGKVDLIFFCNVLHHVENRAEYLGHLKKALKPGGRLAVIEFFKRDLPVGPKDPGHKLSWNETYQILREAGFKVVREPQLLPYQYFMIAKPE